MQSVQYSSEVIVELIKYSAQDIDVARAAWVSTKGEASKDVTQDEAKISGLINYLMRDRHGSPFEHSYFTFYVKAPIFVWREHMRHRIASYNEESGRYAVLKPEFYIPARERNLQQIGKTGHYQFIEGTNDQYAMTKVLFEKQCIDAYQNYEQLLANGIAKEVARIALPLNIYSSAYVTMNARALMNFLSLRQHVEGSHFPSYPQREIEMVAERYEEILKEHMPITYAAFAANGRVAP